MGVEPEKVGIWTSNMAQVTSRDVPKWNNAPEVLEEWAILIMFSDPYCTQQSPHVSFVKMNKIPFAIRHAIKCDMFYT